LKAINLRSAIRNTYFEIKHFLLGVILLLSINNVLYSQSLSLDSVYTIWDQAPHNAFPLMIYFNDYCYVSFREGNAHAGDGGKIRIIRSQNLHDWESVNLIDIVGYDLREGHFSVLPDGRLHLSCTGWLLEDTFILDTYFITTVDGINWSEPILFPYQNHWFYGLTWHDNIGYALADYWGDLWSYFLFVTEDGENFSILDTLSYAGNEIGLLEGATEADILFDSNGHLWASIRSQSNSTLVLANASPPLYTDWAIRGIEHEGNYSPSPGRSELIQLPDGSIFLGTRAEGNHTGLYYLDLDSATTSTALILPSGGDTGYIDMVMQDEEIHVVYYSTHEDTVTRIYFAYIDYGTPLSITESDIPMAYTLYQNYPNPFNSHTTISYSLPKKNFVKVTVHNLLGREIAILKNIEQMAGLHAIQWDATDNMGKSISSGMYFYKVQSGDFIETNTMILLE